MATRKIILCTRELDRELIAGLEAGMEIDVVPFIRTELADVSADQLDHASVLAIFTSRHAIEAVEQLIKGVNAKGWKVACLDGATKTSAERVFGAEAIILTAHDAKELGNKLAGVEPGMKFIFFSGDQRLDTLPMILNRNGRDWQEIVVYRTTATPARIDKQYDGILFFSPSAVKSFFSMNQVPASTVLFCIGATTAKIVGQVTGRDVVISNGHSVEEMLKTVAGYFNEQQVGNDCS